MQRKNLMLMLVLVILVIPACGTSSGAQRVEQSQQSRIVRNSQADIQKDVDQETDYLDNMSEQRREQAKEGSEGGENPW